MTTETLPAADAFTGAVPIFEPTLSVLYLSGPMTGLPEFNYPAFRDAAERLRDVGYSVYNPAEGAAGGTVETDGLTGTEDPSETGFDLRAAFAEYAAHITTDADAIAVLPGWEKSRGAKGEVALALAIGLPVIDALTGRRLNPAFEVVTVVTRDDVPAHLSPVPNTESQQEPKPEPAAPSVHAPVSTPVPASGGEIRTTSATGGQKGVKEARFDLIPPGPLWELAVLYGRGAMKYDADNWKRGYDWSLSYGALKRHLDLFWMGEDHDPEMNLKHLICVAWHAFNLAWFMENRPDFDDRPVNGETYAGALPTPQWLIDLANQGESPS